MHYSRLITFCLVSVSLLLAGCSKFDRSAIPLYDEVFVPPDEQGIDPRRSPVKNPLVMPPGYRKPNFNEYGEEQGSNARLKGIIEQDQKTALEVKEKGYPELSSVPPKPGNISSPNQFEASYDNLTAERDRAQILQEAIRSGAEVPASMIADTRPPELPGEGEENIASKMPWGSKEPVRQPVKTITFAEGEEQKNVMMNPEQEEAYQGGGQVDIADKNMEPTHEFGTPEIVENGDHSTITEMHEVGYASLQEQQSDEDKFRLKPFEYKNVPIINSAKTPPETAVSFNDTQDPPQFLPESRYKARRVAGPVYKGSYNGYTYFQNQY